MYCIFFFIVFLIGEGVWEKLLCGWLGEKRFSFWILIYGNIGNLWCLCIMVEYRIYWVLI